MNIAAFPLDSDAPRSELPPPGTLVVTESGVTGWFIGRTLSGADWVVYQPKDYARVFARFQRLLRSQLLGRKK